MLQYLSVEINRLTFIQGVLKIILLQNILNLLNTYNLW